MGAVTPVGLNAPDSWDAFLAGRSGVGPVTQFDASNYPTRIAAEVTDFNPRDYLERKESRYMARCSQFAVVAAEEALAIWRSHPLGSQAAIVGEVVEEHPGRVVLRSSIGGRRIVDMLSGEQLPRIC